ncbi:MULTISPECIES: hypothetical protein [Okeania]|uniref:Uncharacterized protein n=1 Tax=Okeania hirsuta TaxID=1458930 RepID=A0A3N6Q426_9CYAN|nr:MULTISPECIES: hypothetical protein [Okeania]NET11954.1 hypothetical protein [Okeania sp. SIO1H6]NES76544.1 hypothetical protein [Okeania sp. SIO1H4]NES92763.1 hypothetical protein [Okeania sp. SIO2B9]NET20412.1 hypothetical protein [Okeania sp. SIO1H5]NET76998.1 hypothetical protein [Okeania sp. SIO1F9]
MGNVLGDESKIAAKVTGNSPQSKISPQPKIEKPKKFGFLDFLTWMQNGQIIYYLGSTIIGILLLIIYPKLFPSGFPKLVEKVQYLFPAPQIENESNSSK